MDVGFGEMLMLAVLALVIFGPERLPGIARTVGETIGRIRREASATFETLRDETELSELQEVGSELRRQRDELRSLTSVDTSGVSLRSPARRERKAGPPSFDPQST